MTRSDPTQTIKDSLDDVFKGIVSTIEVLLLCLLWICLCLWDGAKWLWSEAKKIYGDIRDV